MLFKQLILDIPQFFTQVYIIFVRIFKPEHLIPEGVNLFSAVISDFIISGTLYTHFPLSKIWTWSSFA